MNSNEEEYMEENNIEMEQVVFKLPIPLDRYNEAQKLNPIEFTTKYGKIGNDIKGNTRTGRNIMRKKDNNFGSISEYNIDTLPKSFLHLKGIEKTELRQDSKTYNDIDIISRRFLSKILSTWGYITGIGYKRAIEMWTIDIDKIVHKDKVRTYKCISGEEAILLLKDILFLIRDKKYNFKRYKDKISPQLYSVLWGILHDKEHNKEHTKELIDSIKDRCYYTYQAYDKVWATPKYNPNYIISIIKELQSGKYYIDLPVPIINNLYKYPIRCTDMSNTDIDSSEKTSDDYDIGKYIWERE